MVGQHIRVIVAASLLWQSGAQLIHTQSDCDENSSLLEIDFDVTYFEQTTRFVKPYFDWSLRRGDNSRAAGSMFGTTETAPFSGCISEDLCHVILTETLDTEAQVSVRLNGTNVPLGQTITDSSEHRQVHSATEIGICVPLCQNDEALFDLRALAALHPASVPWILQDIRDGTTLRTCSEDSHFCSSDNEIEFFRQCLPRDGCYRFAAGALFDLPVSSGPPSLSFNASFDGTPVADFQGNFFFDSVDFGEACEDTPTVQCEAGESLYQVQLFRWGDQSDDGEPVMSWLLLDGETTDTVLKSGALADKDIGSTQTVSECVPKASCIQFVPFLHDDFRFKCYCEEAGITVECDPGCSKNIHFLYRVLKDGNVIAEDEFRFDVHTNRPPTRALPFRSCSSAGTNNNNSKIGAIVGSLTGVVVLGVCFALAVFCFARRDRETVSGEMDDRPQPV